MKARTILFLAFPLLLLAQEQRSDSTEPPVVMPEVRVYGPPFRSYTFSPYQDRDGSFVLLLTPGPRLPDMLTILVSGAHARDVVIGIKSPYRSIDVGKLSRSTWSNAVDYGDLKLIIRRPVGKQSHRILELDARRIPQN